ncbi:hypothetical protein ECFDA517_1049, partial [Escherichia coli FDA517]
MIVPT